MTTITLNADVLRLIIREAALEAERSSSFSPIDAFYQRSAALRRMSLVNPQWRYLAQLELQSFLVLTTRNFSSISKALEQNGMAKRLEKDAEPSYDFTFELHSKRRRQKPQASAPSSFFHSDGGFNVTKGRLGDA
ncbi:hypothetical protein JCM3765_003010 [Sporobolomyces pararoseus]